MESVRSSAHCFITDGGRCPLIRQIVSGLSSPLVISVCSHSMGRFKEIQLSLALAQLRKMLICPHDSNAATKLELLELLVWKDPGGHACPPALSGTSPPVPVTSSQSLQFPPPTRVTPPIKNKNANNKHLFVEC